MRRPLNIFARFLIGLAVVIGGTCVTVLVTLVVSSPTPVTSRDWPALGVYLIFVVVAVSLIATAGGMLLCLTELTSPLPLPPPGRGRVRFVLRVVAAVQFWCCLALGVAAAATTTYWPTDPRRESLVYTVVTALFVPFGMLGLACVGGVLWCAVRLAYPDAPAKTERVTSAPGAGTVAPPA